MSKPRQDHELMIIAKDCLVRFMAIVELLPPVECQKLIAALQGSSDDPWDIRLIEAAITYIEIGSEEN